MALIETGSNTAGKADVDASFNVMTNTPGYTSGGVIQGGGPAQAGALGMYSVNDEGTVTLSRNVVSPLTSLERRLKVGIDTLLFTDTFNATTQNTSIWEYIFATLTASQPGAGTLNFGTVQGTAATHGALMRTYQYFPLVGSAPLLVDFTVGQFTAIMVANEEFYCGLGRPTVAGTAVTDGVYFKLTPSGLFGECKYNGSATTTASLATLASFSAGTQYKLRIIVNERTITFWRDGIMLGTLTVPVADGQPFIMASLPVFAQKLCTGAVSNTNTMRIGDVSVYLADLASNKPWSEQQATMGQMGYIGQDGHTQGKTSLWTNNTAPTAAALTNTAAAFTGLGGIMAVLPTLAASSDGKLITYQNPVPSINITGRNLVITGVTIYGGVSVALTGGPVTYAFALAFGHTATSLATLETGSFVTATTHAPRIVALGMQNYIVTAPVGTVGNTVQVSFKTPVVVRPGEFIDIVARNIGVVTSLGAITFIIGFDAYWE